MTLTLFLLLHYLHLYHVWNTHIYNNDDYAVINQTKNCNHLAVLTTILDEEHYKTRWIYLVRFELLCQFFRLCWIRFLGTCCTYTVRKITGWATCCQGLFRVAGFCVNSWTSIRFWHIGWTSYRGGRTRSLCGTWIHKRWSGWRGFHPFNWLIILGGWHCGSGLVAHRRFCFGTENRLSRAIRHRPVKLISAVTYSWYGHPFCIYPRALCLAVDWKKKQTQKLWTSLLNTVYMKIRRKRKPTSVDERRDGQRQVYFPLKIKKKSDQPLCAHFLSETQ